MKRILITALLFCVSSLSLCTDILACPFCSAVGQTFAQEIEALDAAVIVTSVELKEMPGPEEEGELPKSTFKVVQVLKGDQWTAPDRVIKTHYFGERKDGTFLIFGADAPDILWTSPLRMTDQSVEYLQAIMKLPEKGPERLAFFQGYLESDDEMLSADAYDEFARAPYEDVVALKPSMKREEILGWIKDTKNVPAARRRLYLTMLGVCGEKEDAKLLEQFMRSDSLDEKLGLDAMVACYLTLRGEEGMPLIKELFLLDTKEPEYSHTYSAIMALRFHAAETGIIPREKILDGFRCLLDREDLADLVIPDLARMEDWDSLPKLVELFRTADPAESWARVPIINFVRACPLPEADEALEKLSKIDPAAVKRASTFFPFAPKKKASADEEKEGSDANEAAAADVPQETQYARTVSAEIALPDVGDADFPSADEYAAVVKASAVAEAVDGSSVASQRMGWQGMTALAVAGLIIVSSVWPKKHVGNG